MSRASVLIAGGGTAGHILPGLSIAEALIARGVPRDEIVWIGSDRGQDATLVGPSGLRTVLLPGRGIRRSMSPEAIRQNAGAVVGLVRALLDALRLVRRERPAVVVSLGGYASVAASLAAVVWRVPLVVAEQNAVAGAANRAAGRFAAACAVPFYGTGLPRSTVTGNPVRQGVLDLRSRSVDDMAAARRRAKADLGLDPDRLLVVAFAGSLGSRRINEAVVELVGRWDAAGVSGLHVHHVVGRRDWASFVAPEPGPTGPSYRAIEYEDGMDRVLAAADLAICRSGGTTVAELAVIGVPSVLVPLPIAPGDHQRHNAAALVAAGAAILVDDADCTGERLDAELTPLVLAPERLAAMAAAAWGTGRPDAAGAVADLVVASARQPLLSRRSGANEPDLRDRTGGVGEGDR